MLIHRNLGHPSNRLFVQILKDAKAPQSIIDMAKDLECPVCERMKSIQPARPANPSRPTEVGEILAVDFSFHTTPNKERFMVINFIDEACKYHIAKVVRRDFCNYNMNVEIVKLMI